MIDNQTSRQTDRQRRSKRRGGNGQSDGKTKMAYNRGNDKSKRSGPLKSNGELRTVVTQQLSWFLLSVVVGGPIKFFQQNHNCAPFSPSTLTTFIFPAIFSLHFLSLSFSLLLHFSFYLYLSRAVHLYLAIHLSKYPSRSLSILSFFMVLFLFNQISSPLSYSSVL